MVTRTLSPLKTKPNIGPTDRRQRIGGSFIAGNALFDEALAQFIENVTAFDIAKPGEVRAAPQATTQQSSGISSFVIPKPKKKRRDVTTSVALPGTGGQRFGTDVFTLTVGSGGQL